MKFSIITITYNAGSVVKRTLDSIMQQDYHDIEHIIIDGASTDDTLSIVEKYKHDSDNAQNGHKILIFSEPDNGIYDAMNKGLAKATGDYIVYMNAGDQMHAPDQLTLCAKKLEETEYGCRPAVIYGHTDLIDNDGKYLGPRKHTPPEKLSWKSFKQGMLVCHQAFYALRELAQQIPFDMQYRHSADVDWCIRVMKEAEKQKMTMLNTHLILADYQQEGNTTKNHRASLMERFQIMRRHYGLITAVAMHAWFVVRAIFRAISKLFR